MSLRLKFLIPLVLVFLSAAAYIGLVWSPEVIGANEKQYLRDVDIHLDTVVEGLTPLVLSNQLDLIQKNLMGLERKNPDWRYIRLTNRNGKWLFPLMVKGAADPPGPSAEIRVLEKEIQYLDRPVGHLVVYVDFSARQDRIRSQQKHLAMILMAVITLFAVVLIAMLEATTIRPLRQLSLATSELAHHNYDVALPPPHSDEIGALIGSFASMRGELKSYRENLMHEVDERRQREQELKHYKAIVESSDDAIVSKTPDGIVTSWNPGAERMFGYTAAEVVGKPLLMITPPERSQEESDILALVAQGKRLEHFETVRQHKNGRLIDISSSVSPILDETGRPAGVSNIARDITERKQLESEQEKVRQELEAQLEKVSELQLRLQEQVIHDPLTGMFNRRFLDETMPRELALAKREGYLLSVVMLDLDHFKRINDTYGHAAGDLVLQAVADVLKSKGRESDIACRYGGEEFVVVLPRMSASQAVSRVEEWRRVIQDMKIRHGELDIQVTLSGGISGFPENGSDTDTLVARADQALYWSKNRGRNRITCFHDIQPGVGPDQSSPG